MILRELDWYVTFTVIIGGLKLVLIKCVTKCRLGVGTSSLPVRVIRIWMTLQDDKVSMLSPRSS